MRMCTDGILASSSSSSVDVVLRLRTGATRSFPPPPLEAPQLPITSLADGDVGEPAGDIAEAVSEQEGGGGEYNVVVSVIGCNRSWLEALEVLRLVFSGSSVLIKPDRREEGLDGGCVFSCWVDSDGGWGWGST